uniref:Uncharacterized protein n=1 Tax=Solanum lycopersicum TaxID=4081 RepID=A0A494G8B4_SOLLC
MARHLETGMGREGEGHDVSRQMCGGLWETRGAITQGWGVIGGTSSTMPKWVARGTMPRGKRVWQGGEASRPNDSRKGVESQSHEARCLEAKGKG